MHTKAAVLLLAMSVAAAAQSSNGYVFFAPGGYTSGDYTDMTLHTGVGGDAILWKGLGLNVEIGAIGPRQEFSAAVGLFSPGGTYYFRRGTEHKVEPFVNGGYSLMFRSGRANLWYAGGGLNYWFAKKLGVRLEIRDHVSTRSCCNTAQFWGVRFGLAFR